MKILFLSAEADPYIKVGGLGDVAGSLPGALRSIDQDLDIRLVIPKHLKLNLVDGEVKATMSFPLVRNEIDEKVDIDRTKKDAVDVFFVDGEPISRSEKVYSSDVEADGLKYFFFSLASIEFMEQDDWIPDVVVANDWHTAISIVDIYNKRSDPKWSQTKTVFTIHNLGYMGAGTNQVLSRFGIQQLERSELPWWGDHMPLPMGIKMADKIVTVSPTYANEIQTPDYGCGLQDFFISRQKDLVGIINGIDHQIWDPATDTVIPRQFTIDDLTGKLENKLALQKEYGFEVNKDIPLFTIVTRMDRQKGVDLLVDAVKLLEEERFQLIILGTGDEKLEQKSVLLGIKFPDKVKTLIKYDAKISRKLYAAADVVLMPSRYEPCGIAQMISMRYGSVPLARTTGGLKDTIKDGKTGFLFEELSAEALAGTIRRAMMRFADTGAWSKIRQNCMREDFSWENSAKKYLELFRSL